MSLQVPGSAWKIKYEAVVPGERNLKLGETINKAK